MGMMKQLMEIPENTIGQIYALEESVAHGYKPTTEETEWYDFFKVYQNALEKHVEDY